MNDSRGVSATAQLGTKIGTTDNLPPAKCLKAKEIGGGMASRTLANEMSHLRAVLKQVGKFGLTRDWRQWNRLTILITRVN
jgi:hypothetical protein